MTQQTFPTDFNEADKIEGKVLSEGTNLSKSAIFTQMRAYYNQKGTEAWETGIVPSFITANRQMAQTYAEIIMGRMLDFLAANPKPKDPFYIVEMCAGPGKLGFYICKALLEMLASYRLPPSTFCYVLTDISQKNLESWDAHPAIKPFMQAGFMDSGIFDAENDKEITLQKSGKVLKEGCLETPIMMIGNYAFDTLSHDAFQIDGGKLYETHVKVINTGSEDDLENLHYEYSRAPVDGQYYDVNAINNVLDAYQGFFDNASILMPIGGLVAVETVRKFSKADIVLMASDKGYHDKLAFPAASDPHVAAHGSVSLMVNFDAVARYFELQGGYSYICDETVSTFHVCLFSSANVDDKPNLQRARDTRLRDFNPSDYFYLQRLKAEKVIYDDLARIVALIRLSLSDSHVFFHMSEPLLELSAQIPPSEQVGLVKVLERIWDSYFMLERHQDIGLAIGKIMVNLGEFTKAQGYFQFSRANFPNQDEAYYGLAICAYQLEQMANAKDFITKARQAAGSNPHVESLYNLIYGIETPDSGA